MTRQRTPRGKAATTAAPSSLLTGLAAYYKLDDAQDSVGTAHLTATAAVTHVAGKVGNCADIPGTHKLSIASGSVPAALQLGDISFTIAAWANFDNLDQDRFIGSQFNNSGVNKRSWQLYYDLTTTKLNFIVSPDGGNATSKTVRSNVVVAPGTWYFVLGEYDAATDTLAIEVNNGGRVATTLVGGAYATADAEWCIGACPLRDMWQDGKIDAFGLWKRLLTTDEKATLYNSGNGREYPFS